MSQVRVSERNESKIQFVDTARELVVHTLHYARKFPKAAMFLLTKDIVDYAKNVYLHTVCANDIFPKTPADVESRQKHLDFAIGCLDTIDCFLGIMKDDYIAIIEGAYRDGKSIDALAEELGVDRETLNSEVFPKILRKLRHPAYSKRLLQYRRFLTETEC